MAETWMTRTRQGNRVGEGEHVHVLMNTNLEMAFTDTMHVPCFSNRTYPPACIATYTACMRVFDTPFSKRSSSSIIYAGWGREKRREVTVYV